MAILEGNDPLERLRTTFGTAYKTNLMLWPWVQAANFTFVPLEHRVLVVNLVSLGTFLPLASLRGILHFFANPQLPISRLELHPQSHKQ